MYRLPDLEPWCAGRCWLSSAGASEAACLLLDEPGASRREGWLSLLRLEPGLVLWAAGGLRWRLDEPPRLSELAEWLEHSAACTLLPQHDQHAPLTSDERGRTARQAGAALAVARAVERLGGDEAALTSALLRHVAQGAAPSWLAACADSSRLPDRLEAEARRRSGSEDPLPDPPGVLRRARRDAGQRWLPVDRPPPLGQLAHLAARSQQLESRFERQLQTEKLASLKELAYGASHELNNPLANITTRAQALLRDEEDSQRRKRLSAIVTQAFRANEMISDMMLFAKPPRLEREPCDLIALTDQVLEEMRAAPEFRGGELLRESAEDVLVIEADPRHLGEALRELCRNALEATGGEGRVRVQLRRELESVVIVVEDNGPGLSSRERRHLFDPFFSGREAGRGLGLGLAKCWTIVRSHGGEIAPLDGLPSRIEVRLPL